VNQLFFNLWYIHEILIFKYKIIIRLIFKYIYILFLHELIFKIFVLNYIDYDYELLFIK